MRRLLFLLLFCTPLAATAQLVEGGSLVRRGEPVRVSTVTDAGVADTLVITHRPNAALARREYLPTGGAREVVWTPQAAGVVRLSVGSVQQNVSVRYQKPPVSGIIVLLIAGFILFGGAAYSLRKLFEP